MKKTAKRKQRRPATRREWTAGRHADVSQFFGVSIDTVKAWAKRGMPGKPNAYRLDLIAQWLRTEGPWRQHIKVDDPLLADGADSPGLERYRLAKAALAELDLAERQHQLVSVERLREQLLRWAVILKRLGQRVQKRWGPDAHRAIEDALGECQRVVDDEFGDATDRSSA